MALVVPEMSINHSCVYVSMTKKLVACAAVASGFKEMGGERPLWVNSGLREASPNPNHNTLRNTLYEYTP